MAPRDSKNATVRKRLAYGVTATLVLLMLLACGGLGSGSDPLTIEEQCHASVGPVDVSGSWTLSGEGTWSDCDNGVEDDAPFEISSTTLTFAQTDEDGDGENERLALDEDYEGFSLENGRVMGTCVEFTTVEQDGGTQISFDFSGSYTSHGVINGTFEGEGPGRCNSSGDFELRRE